MTKLPGPRLRRLKANAQRLEPLLRIGRAGLTEPFLAALDSTLAQHKLVKIKFDHHKENKHLLIPEIITRSNSLPILRVGNVIVLHRPRPPGPVPMNSE